MNLIRKTRPRTLAASLVLAFVGSAAQAQSNPMQSVEVRGQAPVRTDVQALCPDVNNELQDALVGAVQEVASSAVIDVRFELQGSRVGEVKVGNGPAKYQRALRRAVRGLQCEAKEAEPQSVAMKVRFLDPFERSTRSAAATTMVLVSASAPTR